MVREALRTLAERRLLDIVPGRGSLVRGATVAKTVERLIEIFRSQSGDTAAPDRSAIDDRDDGRRAGGNAGRR
jgi:DNA-binding FadR family transcriptional regulator